MKVYIMTDLEGVAGVMNSTDWIYPDSFKPVKISAPYTYYTIYRPNAKRPERCEIFRESENNLIKILG